MEKNIKKMYKNPVFMVPSLNRFQLSCELSQHSRNSLLVFLLYACQVGTCLCNLAGDRGGGAKSNEKTL
jgi:hypothetical protein